MSAVDDACLDSTLRDLLDLEDTAVEALQEAVTWRQMALIALVSLAEQTARADKLERRLRQIAEIEPWHSEAEMMG